MRVVSKFKDNADVLELKLLVREPVYVEVGDYVDVTSRKPYESFEGDLSLIRENGTVQIDVMDLDSGELVSRTININEKLPSTTESRYSIYKIS